MLQIWITFKQGMSGYQKLAEILTYRWFNLHHSLMLCNISAHNMISKWFYIIDVLVKVHLVFQAIFLSLVTKYSTHLYLCATSLLLIHRCPSSGASLMTVCQAA